MSHILAHIIKKKLPVWNSRVLRYPDIPELCKAAKVAFVEGPSKYKGEYKLHNEVPVIVVRAGPETADAGMGLHARARASPAALSKPSSFLKIGLNKSGPRSQFFCSNGIDADGHLSNDVAGRDRSGIRISAGTDRDTIGDLAIFTNMNYIRSHYRSR